MQSTMQKYVKHHSMSIVNKGLITYLLKSRWWEMASEQFFREEKTEIPSVLYVYCINDSCTYNRLYWRYCIHLCYLMYKYILYVLYKLVRSFTCRRCRLAASTYVPHKQQLLARGISCIRDTCTTCVVLYMYATWCIMCDVIHKYVRTSRAYGSCLSCTVLQISTKRRTRKR